MAVLKDGVELRQLPLMMIGLAAAGAVVSFILVLVMCANCPHGKRRPRPRRKIQAEMKRTEAPTMEEEYEEVPQPEVIVKQDNSAENQSVPTLSDSPLSVSPAKTPEYVESGGRLGKSRTDGDAHDQSGLPPPPVADIHGSEQQHPTVATVNSDFKASGNLRAKVARSTATTTMTSQMLTAREISVSDDPPKLKKPSGENKAPPPSIVPSKHGNVSATPKVRLVAAPTYVESNFLPEPASTTKVQTPSTAPQAANEPAEPSPSPVSASRSASIGLSSAPSFEFVHPTAPSPSLGATSQETGVVQVSWTMDALSETSILSDPRQPGKETAVSVSATLA